MNDKTLVVRKAIEDGPCGSRGRFGQARWSVNTLGRRRTMQVCKCDVCESQAGVSVNDEAETSV